MHIETWIPNVLKFFLMVCLTVFISIHRVSVGIYLKLVARLFYENCRSYIALFLFRHFSDKLPILFVLCLCSPGFVFFFIAIWCCSALLNNSFLLFRVTRNYNCFMNTMQYEKYTKLRRFIPNWTSFFKCFAFLNEQTCRLFRLLLHRISSESL